VLRQGSVTTSLQAHELASSVTLRQAYLGADPGGPSLTSAE
jgi:hypothetical protein